MTVFAVTEGVVVSAEVLYRPEYSRPNNQEFIFTYNITIENNSKYTLQLVSRHWKIFDSNNFKREIKGEGVVGMQPILEPNQTHSYTSACNLNSEFGRMSGFYAMVRIMDDKEFTIKIPAFTLEVPFKLN